MGNTAETSTNSPLSVKAFTSIKDDIIHGRLAQGSKLKEEEIAQKYGISRGPLREAIQRLEASKLVVRIPRAGVRVVTLDKKMMDEIYTVREALEGMSARLAAQTMSTVEAEELTALLIEHEQSIEKNDGKNYFQKEGDLDFHYRIASASQNQWLLQLLGSELYQLLRMCRQRSSQMPTRANTALNEHKMIADAIANKDAELAEILMRRHISRSWQAVRKTLQ